MTKEEIVHIKHAKQQNEYITYTYYTGSGLLTDVTDVIPFVIINIFKSDCNLITHSQ